MPGTRADLSSKLAVEVLRGGAEITEELAAEWRRLCDQTPQAEPFYRPEWTQAYLNAFVPKPRLLLLTVRAGGKLCGVLPLLDDRAMLTGLPARRLRCPGNVHCCRLGPAYLEGSEGEQALQMMWHGIRELPAWNMLEFGYVPEGNGLDQVAAFAEQEGFVVVRKPLFESLHLCYTLSVDVSPGWLRSTRPKFRSNLRRTRRQLKDLGAIATEHFTTADSKALERFYQVERSGWKGREGTAIDCDPRTRQFYDQVATAAARDGLLSLDFLEVNGKTIAAHFALSFHGRYLLAKAGYDESYQRYGPGQLLVNEVLSQSEQRGLRELDFVGPATWDETRWAESRRRHYRIFIFRRGWYGALLHAAHVRARQAAKRFLGRANHDPASLVEDSLPDHPERDSGKDS